MHIGYIVGMKAGLEAFIYREIDELIQRSVNITLFVTKLNKNDIYSPRQDWNYYYFSKLKIIFIVPFLFFINPIKNFILLIEALKTNSLIDLIFALVFARAMKSAKIDLVHSTFGDHKLFIAYYCKRILNLPLTTTIHAHEIHANPNAKMFKKSLLACNRIITIAAYNKKLLVEKFNVPSDLIDVIKLSIDTNLFSMEKIKKVLTVSRFTERKGFDILFEAITLMNNRAVEFIIIGFGSLDLNELADRYGISDRITIFDKMNPKQLKFFYQNCDIFCLPSKSTEKEGKEGIPVVLMEAMACGMPIVATNNGAIPELVPEVIVEENNASALAQGLDQVLSHLSAYQQNRFRNRKIIEETHGSRNIDALKNEFERVVANG